MNIWNRGIEEEQGKAGESQTERMQLWKTVFPNDQTGELVESKLYPSERIRSALAEVTVQINDIFENFKERPSETVRNVNGVPQFTEEPRWWWRRWWDAGLKARAAQMNN